MKTTSQRITEIENAYAGCTLAEAFALFRKVSAECMDTIQTKAKAMRRIIGRNISKLRRTKKRVSCLAPMKCNSVYPLGYHIGAAQMPRTTAAFQFNFGMWKGYLYQLKALRVCDLIDQELAMEQTLHEAQKLLIQK